MIVYGACWYDTTEPWVWDIESLYWERSDAEKRRAELVTQAYDRMIEDGIDTDTAHENAERSYRVQEYDLSGDLPVNVERWQEILGDSFDTVRMMGSYEMMCQLERAPRITGAARDLVFELAEQLLEALKQRGVKFKESE